MAASDPWRELGLTQKMCEATLRAPFRENYLAAVGRSFAGLITVTMYGTFKGYIQSLFVAESFRGRGIGEKLVAAAEARVFRVSPNVFLCVSSFNKGAIKFYRRLGYKKAGLLTDFVKRGHDELLMRKTRGPLLSYKAGKK
jgi:ribosomal protein S18 acetylase RimI-like enzyme